MSSMSVTGDEPEDSSNLPSSPMRSQSYEHPRPKSTGYILSGHRAHFEDLPGQSHNRSSQINMRPRLSKRTTSFSMKRKSMARTISSLSVYSHFAGERLDDPRPQPHSHDWANNEKRRSAYSLGTIKQNGSSDIVTGEEVEEVSRPTASVGKAMFMFLKAFIGSGVLFLPKAFQNGGLALSIALMVLIALICLYAFLRLVKVQQIIGGSYGDMGCVLYGQVVRYTVLFFIVISQIGFVCSYLVFISGNLVNIVDVLSNCTAYIEQKYYIWMPLVIIIPLSLVRHIARLSICAIIADLFILFGLVCVLYFTASSIRENGVGPNIQSVNPADFGLMIGTATFSFEGIGLVIPIVESMSEPERFPFVVTVGTSIVCVIYILIGTISYLAYGDRIQAAVVYNFPPSNGLTIAVQLLYSVAIILTAPLMLFPALKIIENGLFRKFGSGSDNWKIKWSKNVYRSLLCCLCAVISFAIGSDNLDKFVSLVGSVACVPLCFVFPGMFHIKVASTTINRICDAILIIWGVGIMIYTLYVTINSFVHPSPSEPATPYCPR